MFNYSPPPFRVVALSATPGKDIQAVQGMLQNLMISHIELRSEDSLDIVPYTHERTIEKVVVPIGIELAEIRNKYLSILEYFVKRLNRNGVLAKRNNNTVNPTNYTKFGILSARDEFRKNPPARMDRSTAGSCEGDFAASISLYHAYELLMQHGMRAFKNFLLKTIDEKDGNRRLRFELKRLESWKEIEAQLEAKFSEDKNNSHLNSSKPQMLSQFGPTQEKRASTASLQQDSLVLGHPKLEKLKELVVAHFREKKNENVATRVMIFSQYRDSVQEITACLHYFKPLIKVMEFVGQAGTKGNLLNWVQNLDEISQSFFYRREM